jgi:hypothetical protein
MFNKPVSPATTTTTTVRHTQDQHTAMKQQIMGIVKKILPAHRSPFQK